MTTPMSTARSGETSIFQRMLGAALLKPATYEEVEADPNAIPQAALIVVVVAIAAGIGALSQGVTALILGIVIALAQWAVWAGLIMVIGTKVLPEKQTSSNWGELLRTLGFAQTPGLVRVLGIIPGIGGFFFFAASIWQLVAAIFAVKAALDFNSWLRTIIVVVLAWIPMAVLFALVYTVV